MAPTISREGSEFKMKGDTPPVCDCIKPEPKEAPSGIPKSNSESSCCMKQKAWSMFQDKSFSDVCFIVGSEPQIEKIHAHKFILSAGSSVLKDMIENMSSESNEIKIPEIEPSLFYILIRFIYIDDVELSVESVLKIMCAAKKYAVHTLEEKCMKFFHKNLDRSLDSCNLLNEARSLNELVLVQHCLEAIDKDPADKLMDDDFLSIDAQTLKLILERDTLKVNEAFLFQMVLRWSKAECRKRGLPVNPENRKAVLEGAESLIRFCLMSQREFASLVVPSGLLSNEETLDMFMFYSQSPKLYLSSNLPRPSEISRKRIAEKKFSNSQFSNEPRLGTSIEIVVQTLTCYMLTFRVNMFCLVETLKSKIQFEKGICPALQHLRYCGQLLEDGHTLSDYKVQNYSSIILSLDRDETHSCHKCRSKIQIFLDPFGKVKLIHLTVEKTDTVKSIKERIQDRDDVCTFKCRLSYGGELFDDDMLSDYDIEDGAIIMLFGPLGLIGGIEHDCQICAGETIWLLTEYGNQSLEFVLKTSTLIADVIKKIEDKREEQFYDGYEEGERIPLGQLCLSLDGQVLDNDRTLADYDIDYDSTLFISSVASRDVGM